MTEYEVGQLIVEYMSVLNQLTEFWLTISFAVVVAATYVPARLEQKFFTLIWSGYLAASLIFFFNRINLTYTVVRMANSSQQAGVSVPEYHPVFGLLGAGGIFLLMLVGTLGVVYYVRNIGRKRSF